MRQVLTDPSAAERLRADVTALRNTFSRQPGTARSRGIAGVAAKREATAAINRITATVASVYELSDAAHEHFAVLTKTVESSADSGASCAGADKAGQQMHEAVPY